MAMAALPQDPDLDQLRTQARELQRAVRAGDEAALGRVARWHPQPPLPDELRLTAAQLVLAREHGFASWARLRRYVQIVTGRRWTPARAAPSDESTADRFLRLACLTYSDDKAADRRAATQLLAEHPDLPAQNLFVAAACADVAEVRRHLAHRPAAAHETGGPHGWSPLLYQAYARHDLQIDLSATLGAANLLLAAGADPNDGRFWHALPTPFTVLTGVLGYGEKANPGIGMRSRSPGCSCRRGRTPTTGRPCTTACSAPMTIIWCCCSSTASAATPMVRGIGCWVNPWNHRP